MRIQPLLLLILTLVCSNLKAQLSAYYFSASSGTYTPITGTAINLASSEEDEGTTGLKPIGFTFRYNGTDYTQLDICTNGFVQLGAAISKVNGVLGGNNLPNNVYRNVLAPLWDDLKVGTPGGIRYETSGTAPDRVFTVQWSKVYWDYASANPSIEFQLKLYETSNRIEFIYNQLSAAVKAGAAVIGINITGSGSGSFYTLTDAGPNPSLNSDAFKYYVTNKKPATGQVYAFFIPVPCTGTPDGGTTQSPADLVCAGSDFKLSVSGATLAQNLSYQWQTSSNGSNWHNIASATDTNYIAQQNSDTWYRRAITCGSNTAYSTPLQVKTGVLPVQYATLPFTENFETTWLSNCGLRERPSLHFMNSVPTGNRSWRRDDDAAAGDWSSPSFNLWPGGNTSRAARFRVRDEFSAPVHSTGDLDLYVDCSLAGTKELRFRHAQSSGATSLTVWYSTDGGSNFTILGDIPGWALWKDQHIIIPSNSPATVIRFRGQGAGYSSSSDIGIDDIQVQVMNCKFPDGLIVKDQNQTSATITWNHEAGSAYEYKLTTVRDELIGSVQTTTDAQVQLTTDPASDYFFYVRRKCDNNNYSSWTMLPLSPSMDCSIATALNCSAPTSFRIDDGDGRYNLWLTDRSNNCNGGGGYGMEKLMRIVPQISGNYKLKVTATTAQYPVTYYIKDASLGCGPYNWTCLGNTVNPVTFDLGSLSAGKEYFLLIDLFTIVNGHNETIELICTGTNADCVTGNITPVGPISICTGENQQLQVSGGTGWQWFRNHAIIDGANTNAYIPTQNGNYSVAITNGSCTKVSNTVKFDIKYFAAPVVTFTGTTHLCEGETLQLNTNAVSGNTYQWQKTEQTSITQTAKITQSAQLATIQ